MDCIKCQNKALKIDVDYYSLYCGKSACVADMDVEAPRPTAPATFSEWVEFYRTRGEDYATACFWARDEMEDQKHREAQKRNA